MTFLGWNWMHRKLTHDGAEPTKNSIIAETFFDEQDYYIEQTKNVSHSKTSFHKSLNSFKSDKVDILFQEGLLETFEFLAIGTLGMELHGTEPPTPTMPAPSEDLTDFQAEITENGLKQINYELEKFLEAEEKDLANDTSGRNSLASIITLSSKPIDGEDSDGQTYFTDFPLQNYLLANSVEVAETNNEVRKEKTSLEDLFKRNAIENVDPTRNLKGAFKGAEQHSRKRNVTRFMKKVVKKLQSLSRSPTATSKDKTTVPTPIKKKLSKVLKMLQRKVHPEEMTDKPLRNKDDYIEIDDGNKMVGPAASNKSGKKRKKSSSDNACTDSSTFNGGRWIKTDSDYLVLEL